MDYKEIVQRLSLIRTRKNMSSIELSKLLGNSNTYFYKVEGGSIILNIPKLLEILEVLGVSTEEFFYKDFDNYENDINVLNAIKKLSREELDSLLILLKCKQQS